MHSLHIRAATSDCALRVLHALHLGNFLCMFYCFFHFFFFSVFVRFSCIHSLVFSIIMWIFVPYTQPNGVNFVRNKKEREREWTRVLLVYFSFFIFRNSCGFRSLATVCYACKTASFTSRGSNRLRACASVCVFWCVAMCVDEYVKLLRYLTAPHIHAVPLSLARSLIDWLQCSWKFSCFSFLPTLLFMSFIAFMLWMRNMF